MALLLNSSETPKNKSNNSRTSMRLDAFTVAGFGKLLVTDRTRKCLRSYDVKPYPYDYARVHKALGPKVRVFGGLLTVLRSLSSTFCMKPQHRTHTGNTAGPGQGSFVSCVPR